MKSVGSFYAKTHFSQLLEQIHKGEKVIITKHGKSVAILAPYEELSEKKIKNTLQRMQKLRQKIKNKITLDEILKMKEEGRR